MNFAVLMPLLSVGLSLMQPQTSETGFALDLPVRKELLKKARTIVQADETTIFIPGAAGLTGDLQLGQGPVARIRARSGSRGLALTLSARDSFRKVGQPVLEQGAKPMLRVGHLEEASTKQAKALAPVAAKTAPETALGWDTRTPSKTAASERPRPLAQRLFPAGVALLALCVAAFYMVRKKRGTPAHNAHSISVVAARALGGRHKLAVVQVDGERLLLAMNDREVSLLSHLASAQAAVDPSPPTAAERRFVLPTGSPPLAQPVPSTYGAAAVPAPPAQAAPLPQSQEALAGLSSDVAGLLHLRQPPPEAAAASGGAST